MTEVVGQVNTSPASSPAMPLPYDSVGPPTPPCQISGDRAYPGDHSWENFSDRNGAVNGTLSHWEDLAVSLRQCEPSAHSGMTRKKISRKKNHQKTKGWTAPTPACTPMKPYKAKETAPVEDEEEEVCNFLKFCKKNTHSSGVYINTQHPFSQSNITPIF